MGLKKLCAGLFVVLLIFSKLAFALGSGGGASGDSYNPTFYSFWSKIAGQLNGTGVLGIGGLISDNVNNIPQTNDFNIKEKSTFDSTVNKYNLNFTVSNTSEGDYIWGFLVGLSGVTKENLKDLEVYPNGNKVSNVEQQPYWKAWILAVDSDDVYDLSDFYSDLQETFGIMDDDLLQLIQQVYGNYSFVFLASFDFWAYEAGEIPCLLPISPGETSNGFGILSPFYLPPNSPSIFISTKSPNNLTGFNITKNETDHDNSSNQPVAPEPSSALAFIFGIGGLFLAKKNRI